MGIQSASPVGAVSAVAAASAAQEAMALAAQLMGDALASEAAAPLASGTATPSPPTSSAPGSPAWAGVSTAAQARPLELASSEAHKDLGDAAGQTTDLQVPGVSTASTSTAARAPETVVVPTLVNTMQGEATRGPERRAWQSPARPVRRARRPLPQLDDDTDDERDDDDGAPPFNVLTDHDPISSGTTPRVAAPAATSAAYRRLSQVLADADQVDALRELARSRRVLIASPRAAAVEGSPALVLDLLWTDARGARRVQTYRARGARGSDIAPAWRAWRLHRDAGADGQPRLFAGKGLDAASRAVGPLALRLTQVRAAPSLRDSTAPWIDLLEMRRLLHDMGGQWSLLLVWSPQPMPGLSS